MKKQVLSLLGTILLSAAASAQTKGLIISEVLTNPSGNDSPYEYVELVATTSINFASTPYTVVFTDNGTATSNGWKAGSAVTYAFQISSGSVTAGQVVYVGGSSMAPLNNSGLALRTKNTGSSGGDSFGSSNSDGVLGNGGSNCDGIAVFNVAASAITASTVPVDALFFGDAAGSAYKTATSGYQMPVNDLYNGGKLATSLFLAPDPGSNEIVKATGGTFNPATNSFTTARTWAKTSSASYNTTSITLTAAGGTNVFPVVTLATAVSGVAPATITLTAAASDADGTISSVKFYNGTTLLATISSAPYTYAWTNVSAGTYSLTAKATDNVSAVTTSSVSTATVNAASGNTPPTIAFAVPTVSGTAPATVSLSATASDADGTISSVKFYNGSTLLATIVAAPYTYNWTNVSAGTYSLTAQATDNGNAVTTSAVRTVVVTGAANTAPTLSFNTTASNYVSLSSGKVSSVRNDPTDPARIAGLDINVNDENLAALTFTMTSSNTSVLPNANFTIVGTGTARKFKLNPTGVGYTTVTLRVADAQGLNSAQVSISLAVSNALATTSIKDIYHTGVADGSTGVPVDADYMFVADDETNVIKLFNRNNSGLSVYQFDVTPYLGLDGTEVDMEASFRSPTNPNRIYWMGSLSNSKSGEARPDRNRIFATDIVGTGANATLVFVGYYSNLRSKLITWGNNNGYNFTAKAATGIEPKRIDGFNIEGLEMGPDGTTMYIGFRAPYVGTGTNKALICPLLNFEAWFNNGAPSGNPVFGAPIQLTLNNHGIRSLAKNANNQYLIVAGSYAATGTFELYQWDGLAASAPLLLNADLTNLKPEGIVEAPASFMGAFQVDLISDLGSNILYNDGLENKEVVQANHRKFVTSTISVSGGGARPENVAALSLNETQQGHISYYPNPVADQLVIELERDMEQSAAFTIYSVTGALIRTARADVQANKAVLDLSELLPGNYFIQSDQFTAILQIVK